VKLAPIRAGLLAYGVLAICLGVLGTVLVFLVAPRPAITGAETGVGAVVISVIAAVFESDRVRRTARYAEPLPREAEGVRVPLTVREMSSLVAWGVIGGCALAFQTRNLAASAFGLSAGTGVGHQWAARWVAAWEVREGVVLLGDRRWRWRSDIRGYVGVPDCDFMSGHERPPSSY
jgi:hypothetical protein